jgi:hypothetical protein
LTDIRSGEIKKKVRFARSGTTLTRSPTMWSIPARSQATAVLTAEWSP